jgi:hypothetical protein
VTAAALFDTPAVPEHPARYTPGVLAVVARLLDRHGIESGARVLDPFAGTGGIHRVARWATVGVELEPEWARAHPRTIVGDATRLPFAAGSFAAVATSPAYGNRMADSYDGRDGSDRRTYRIALGRPLDTRSGAALQWGPAYRDLHGQAVAEMARVVRPGGLVVVNMRDHTRAHRPVDAVGWWTRTLVAAGLELLAVEEVATPGYRYGANHHARTDGEALIVTRNPR